MGRDGANAVRASAAAAWRALKPQRVPTPGDTSELEINVL
jgi:hypothetical protein